MYGLLFARMSLVSRELNLHDAILSEARFPFKRNRLRCVNENRKKCKRLRLLRENFTQHNLTEYYNFSVVKVENRPT